MDIGPFMVTQGVTDFGADQKPICNFVLVNNANLCPVLHHFQVTAVYWSFVAVDRGASLFNSFIFGDLFCSAQHISIY